MQLNAICEFVKSPDFHQCKEYCLFLNPLLQSLSPLPFALRFLGTLKQHTIQGSVHGEDDLNVEHLQLLLLLFHNLSERGRRSVLTLVTQAITEVAQSRDSQLKAVPLNLARLLLVFDYLLRHYSKAPLYLFEQVSTYFLMVVFVLP